MVTWKEGTIGSHTSNYAIRHNNYMIARFVTVINNEKIERYLLSDISSEPHKSIRWFDSAQKAKDYYEQFIIK